MARSKPRLMVLEADEQIPHMLKAEQGMSAIDKFISDEKPDIMARLGDMLDMEALNGWTRMSPAEVNWDEIRDEIATANAYLDRQDALLKPDCEKHFWMGNHEERLMKFRQKNYAHPFWVKNKDTIPYLMRDLKFKERGYRVHSQNQLHAFGKLYAFHGDNYSTQHTMKNLQHYGVNLVYGHIHTPQLSSAISPVNGAFRQAQSLGCLCNRNPVWKNGACNSWVNGFAIAYLHDDGNYNLYQINIIKGGFVAPNGKYYS